MRTETIVLFSVLIVAVLAVVSLTSITGNFGLNQDIEKIKGMLKDSNGKPLLFGIKRYSWKMPDGEVVRVRSGQYGFVAAKRVNGKYIGHGNHYVNSDEYWLHFYMANYNEWQNDEYIIVEVGKFDTLGGGRHKLYHCTNILVQDLHDARKASRSPAMFYDLQCEIEGIR